MPLIQVLNATPITTAQKRELPAAPAGPCADVVEIRSDTSRIIPDESPRENRTIAGANLANSGQEATADGSPGHD